MDLSSLLDESLLQSWGLLGVIHRELARDQLLSKAIPLTEEQRQQSLGAYLAYLGLSQQADVQRWALAEAVDQEALQCRAERFLAWRILCEQRYKSQISSLFLKRKSALDRVVYYIYWTDDEALAHELFIRLKEQECSFEHLLSSLPSSVGAPIDCGKHGPIALSDVPPTLAELLRVSEPGQTWPPKPAEGGWVIVQLKELQPAVFNQSIKLELALELGDQLLKECIESFSKQEKLRRLPGS